MQFELVQNPLHSYNAVETFYGYLYKIFPDMWCVKMAQKILSTSVLGRKRQRHFQDYWKSFVSLLILLVNDQILEFAWTILPPKFHRYWPEKFWILNTGSSRNKFWNLMIHVTVYCAQRVLELRRVLNTELKIYSSL